VIWEKYILYGLIHYFSVPEYQEYQNCASDRVYKQKQLVVYHTVLGDVSSKMLLRIMK